MYQGNNINFKGMNNINIKRVAEDTINIGKKRAYCGSEVLIPSILIMRNI